jgi:heptosyltransferase I
MRVLIVRVGAMGDVLHALPAVAALRRARPEWRIDWVVDERWAPLLSRESSYGRSRGGSILDVVHHAAVKEWSANPASLLTFRRVVNLRRQMRERDYDIAVDMQGTIRSSIIAWMSGVKRVVGYVDPRESLARRFYSETVERQGVHVVEQGRALLQRAVDVELELGAIPLPFEPVEEAKARRLFEEAGRFCWMAPRAGWGAKQWPAEKFGELAARLAEVGVATLVNAVGENDEVAAQVVSASGGAARMVACGVAELTSLLRRAALFVGGDSGPTHLAAALGVPLVGLYGPTDPARNGPWGAGRCRVLRHGSSATSHKRVEEIDHGLARIEVGEVFEAALGLLSGEG